MARLLQHSIIALLLTLVAGNVLAQSDPVAKARLDNQGRILTQIAGRLVAVEAALKAAGVGEARVRQIVRDLGDSLFVSMPHRKPNGVWNRREADEARFRTELRDELNGYNDAISELEYAVAHPKRGSRKDAIKRIRQERGW